MPLGWQELAIILLIVIVIFGAGKLPEIGSGLGKGIRGFKEESGMGGPDDKKDDAAAIGKGESTTTSTLTASARDSREEVEAAQREQREQGIRADEI